MTRADARAESAPAPVVEKELAELPRSAPIPRPEVAQTPPSDPVSQATVEQARAALPALQESLQRVIPQAMTTEQFKKALDRAVTENEKGR